MDGNKEFYKILKGIMEEIKVSKKTIEDVLRRKIDEASKEIEKCDLHIIDRLTYTTLIAAKSSERKIFSENEYEKYMEEIWKVSNDFKDKCRCQKFKNIQNI